MNPLLIAVKGVLLLALGCRTGAPPPDVELEAATAGEVAIASRARSADACSLARNGRSTADGELLALAIEDRLAYIISGATAYTGGRS